MEIHSTSKVFYFLTPIYFYTLILSVHPISQENAGFFHKINKIRNTIVLYGVEYEYMVMTSIHNTASSYRTLSIIPIILD